MGARALLDSSTAQGTRADVVPVLKRRFDADPAELVLVFDQDTRRQVDFDLRGSLDEVLEREAPKPRRTRGRPRLGGVSREVSLLPRHWEWPEQHPKRISPTVRLLVERASKAQPGPERARRLRDALTRFLSAIAGDLPKYEEAVRALYAGDMGRFETAADGWPEDIRSHVLERAAEAPRADRERSLEGDRAAAVVAELYRLVWSEGDEAAIERLVVPACTVHADPGDAWEGQTLDRAT